MIGDHKLTVRITQANQIRKWYATKVGEEIEVYEYSHQFYIIKEDWDRMTGMTRLIAKADAEIVEA